MMFCSNCTECKNQIDKIIETEKGIKVIPACKAFPDGIPHKEYNQVDFNTERECANGFHFEYEDKIKKLLEQMQEQSKQKKETIFDKVKKLIKR